MILQRVKVTKLKTEDDHWQIEAPVALGTEYWAQPRELRVMEALSKATGERFKTLMIPTEYGTWMPVELLEFSNDFKISN